MLQLLRGLGILPRRRRRPAARAMPQVRRSDGENHENNKRRRKSSAAARRRHSKLSDDEGSFDESAVLRILARFASKCTCKKLDPTLREWAEASSTSAAVSQARQLAVERLQRFCCACDSVDARVLLHAAGLHRAARQLDKAKLCCAERLRHVTQRALVAAGLSREAAERVFRLFGLDLSDLHALDELPDSLPAALPGNVILRGCAALLRLGPSDLVVGGDLDLSGCSSLQMLPAGLHVRGSLLLSGCHGLARRGGHATNSSLPAALRVDGDLSATDVPESHGALLLPETLNVGGAATFTHCAVALPEHLNARCRLLCFEDVSSVAFPARGGFWRALHVAGALHVSRVAGLETLAPFTTVEDDLLLQQLPALEALPPTLEVLGDCAVDGCGRLTRVPATAVFGGDLLLSSCPSLESLELQSIGGALVVSQCESLREIKPGLQLQGGLELDGCAQLSALPPALVVRGNLLLGPGLDALQRLPPGWTVLKSAELRGLSSLTAIEPPFNVRGDATVKDCPLLEFFPGAGSSIGGDLSLASLASLRVLDDGLELGVDGGALTIMSCERLQRLPVDLRLSGTLRIEHAPALTALPDALVVGGRVCLDHCHALTSLPVELFSGGRDEKATSPAGLAVRNCASLTRLPWKTLRVVSGSLDLRSNASLASLPRVVVDDGDLLLSGSAALTAVPARCSVSGNVTTVGCAGLREFGADLRVGGDLNATWCARLASIGKGSTVAGRLLLDGCEELVRLPRSLFHKAPKQVCAVGCPLDRRSLERLQTAGLALHVQQATPPRATTLPVTRSEAASAVAAAEALEISQAIASPRLSPEQRQTILEEFHARQAARGQQEPCSPLDALAKEWFRDAGLKTSAAPRLSYFVSSGDVRAVTLFLEKLRSSAEYTKGAKFRLGLAARVVDALDMIAGGSSGDEAAAAAARAEVVSRISDSLDRCNDKPVWALSQLALCAAVARARGDADALRDLGRKVLRLEIVREHAARFISQRGASADDVSVYLQFEVGLRDRLGLPVGARALLYPSYGGVQDKDLDAAEAEASGVSEERFERWLEDWGEWQRLLRAQAAAQLGDWEALPAHDHVHGSSSASEGGWTDLLGDPVTDPVILGGAVWSLKDFLRHWQETGMDLNNVPRSAEEVSAGLRRIAAEAAASPSAPPLSEHEH